MADIQPAPSANLAWLQLLSDITETGLACAPRKLRILELLAHTTWVDMNRPIVTVPGRKLGYRFLAAEAWWILTGHNDVASIEPYSKHIAACSNDGVRFDGAYGPRIVDQLRYVIDTLEDDPDSRQAVLEIWRPNPRPSKDVPCTLTIQWMIRDGHLHCIDTMRSSDAWLGWPYDTFNFSMLSAYNLLELRERAMWFDNLRLGSLYLTAGSSHLYIDPKADGAEHIPYSLNDVQRVLTQTDASETYQPFILTEFKYPQQLIEHLEACKDKHGRMSWMREFQES
jgi:thymidylate synthase